MVRTLTLALILLNCGLPISVSTAQLLRGGPATPAAREPARPGLLGGLREARDERFRREEQAAIAAARAAAAQRSAAANPRANANLSGPQAAGVANNKLTPNQQRSLEAAKADLNSRTNNYRGPNGLAANRGQDNVGMGNSKINASNSLSQPTPVTPASATAFVPEPRGYVGWGVAIRLPKEARSIVNYLIDDVEAATIRPGEQQVLDTKGSYTVRYSRGVTANGQSFGESNYTITEGRYRFDLTATGWELYRESDVDAKLAPPNQLELAETQAMERESFESPIPRPSMQSELQRTFATEPTPRAEAAAETLRKPLVNEPTAGEPIGNEEVLPAPKPRSILE